MKYLQVEVQEEEEVDPILPLQKLSRVRFI
jgi:hypothetical protein